MGGRVAEEIVFGDITSGAENDIQKATQMARRMVTQWGMSDKLGTVAMGHREELVFLGRDLGEQRNYSEEVAAIIDEEIRSIVDHGYQTATAILTQQRHKMDAVVEQLKVVETLDAKELDEILAREAPGSAGRQLDRLLARAAQRPPLIVVGRGNLGRTPGDRAFRAAGPAGRAAAGQERHRRVWSAACGSASRGDRLPGRARRAPCRRSPAQLARAGRPIPELCRLRPRQRRAPAGRARAAARRATRSVRSIRCSPFRSRVRPSLSARDRRRGRREQPRRCGDARAAWPAQSARGPKRVDDAPACHLPRGGRASPPTTSTRCWARRSRLLDEPGLEREGSRDQGCSPLAEGAAGERPEAGTGGSAHGPDSAWRRDDRRASPGLARRAGRLSESPAGPPADGPISYARPDRARDRREGGPGARGGRADAAGR